MSGASRPDVMAPPTRSTPLTVRPEWIDFNGHLNMAYYSVLFDQAVDQLYPWIGFGPAYQRTGFTTYVAEWHICYLRELHAGDEVVVDFRLIDYDAKRFHSYQELRHVDGWLAAVAEGLTLHVDQSGPRVAPMPEAILEQLGKLHDAQKDQPRPDRLGRTIGIARR